MFLTSLVAGTIVNQLQQFVQNPSSIISDLGAAAPQTATFFMLYLLLTGLVAKPIQFLRFPGKLPSQQALQEECAILKSSMKSCRVAWEAMQAMQASVKVFACSHCLDNKKMNQIIHLGSKFLEGTRTYNFFRLDP